MAHIRKPLKKGTGYTLETIRGWRAWLLRKTSDMGGFGRRIFSVRKAVVTVNVKNTITVRLYLDDGVSYTQTWQDYRLFVKFFLKWFVKWKPIEFSFISAVYEPETYEIARKIAKIYLSELKEQNIKKDIRVNGFSIY